MTSMNKSDCFILDGGKGKSIMVYMPPGSFSPLDLSPWIYIMQKTVVGGGGEMAIEEKKKGVRGIK